MSPSPLKAIRPASLLAVSVLLSWLLAACGSAAPLSPNATHSLAIPNPLPPSRTPFQPKSPAPATSTTANAPQLVSGPSSTPETSAKSAVSLWSAPYLPAALRRSLVLPTGITAVEESTQGQLRLEVGDQTPLSHWIYALVAPYPTIPDGVSFQDIKRSWQGESAGSFAPQGPGPAHCG